MAELLHALPGLSFHFGLTKADLWDLSPAELRSYLDALDELNKPRR